MQTCCETFSFKTILTSDKPTFHHNNEKSMSEIDHILYFLPSKSKVKVKMEQHLCKLDYSSNSSSHDVLIGRIILPSVSSIEKETDYSTTYTQFPVAKPK